MMTAKAAVRRRFYHFALIFMMLWQCMLCCDTVWAALRAPDFSVEGIQAVGVSDRAFAEAIFESISEAIEDGSYPVQANDSTEKILQEYGTETEYAVIRASGRQIQDISGIRLLRKATYIDLSENEITDLSPLAATANALEEQTYFAARELDLRGNPIERVPEHLLGFEDGIYLLDECFTLPLPLVFREGELTKELVLHSTEQGASREKAIFFQNRSELEQMQNAEDAFQHSFTAVSAYRSNATEERQLTLRWSLPFVSRFVREFRDEIKCKSAGCVELIAETVDGEALAGIGYRLFRESEDAETLALSETEFRTDATGKILITDLPSGNYRLELTEQNAGYHSLQEAFCFTIEDDSGLEVSLLEADTPLSDTEHFLSGGDVRRIRFSSSEFLRGVEFEHTSLSEPHAHERRLFKGEILEREGYVLLPESRVLIYEDEVLLGTYGSPAEARRALNRHLQDGSLQDGSQRILVAEELSCLGPPQRLRAVFAKQKADGIARIVVKKSWGAVGAEQEAYFRPLLLRDGKAIAVLGEVKAVSADNDWETHWDFTASASNARRSGIWNRRASESNAEEDPFREDAVIYPAALPDGCEIGVEEINIPDGWVPQYEALRKEGDSAIFYVCNQPAFPGYAENVILSPRYEQPIARREKGETRSRYVKMRAGMRENTASVLRAEALRQETEVKGSRGTVEHTGATESERKEENKEDSRLRIGNTRERQVKMPLPSVSLESCKIYRGRARRANFPENRQGFRRKAKAKRRGHKLPKTGEQGGGICMDFTLLLAFLLVIVEGQLLARRCSAANRGSDRC